jgi:hypothetical protein
MPVGGVRNCTTKARLAGNTGWDCDIVEPFVTRRWFMVHANFLLSALDYILRCLFKPISRAFKDGGARALCCLNTV